MTNDEDQHEGTLDLARALAARLVPAQPGDLQVVTVEELARRAVEPTPAELTAVEDQPAELHPPNDPSGLAG